MLLQTAEFVYNNSFNHSLKMTPFKYVYGYDPELHVDVGDAVPEGEIPSAKERAETLKKLRRELQRQMIKAQEHQAKYYNLRHKPMEFKRGQLVKLSTRNWK